MTAGEKREIEELRSQVETLAEKVDALTAALVASAICGQSCHHYHYTLSPPPANPNVFPPHPYTIWSSTSGGGGGVSGGGASSCSIGSGGSGGNGGGGTSWA